MTFAHSTREGALPIAHEIWTLVGRTLRVSCWAYCARRLGEDASPYLLASKRRIQRTRICVAMLFAGAFGSAAEPRPNVLFIAIDDLRPALGCYGDPLARTPQMDRLAALGLLFERAYCQQALCAPSRASVLTGRRPDAFPEIAAGREALHFRATLPDVVTLPQLFKQHGWHAVSIGKVNHVYPAILDPPSWSEPERIADIPKRDEYLAPANRTRDFIDAMAKGTATECLDVPDSAYQDGQAADLAIETLQRLKDRVFFLAVGFKRPHLPWTAPQKYWQLHEREKFALADDYAPPTDFPWRSEWRPGTGEMRNYTDIPRDTSVPTEKAAELRHAYYAAASYVDAQVGRMIDEVDRLGLASRTIIVLWSDHGYHLGENAQWGKKTNTELDLRVPLIVVAPGRTRAGSRTRALVELVDLYPTLAEIASLPVDRALEGRSFATLLTTPTGAGKPAAFSQYQRDDIVGRSVRTESYRYTEWFNLKTQQVIDRELYAVESDPLERNNLATANKYAATVREHAHLLEHRKVGQAFDLPFELPKGASQTRPTQNR
jgi:iduronate 2-sulfatase